ncbi:hypothetical protein [Streptomyces sp. H27-D2]|uniref:hypothetical protein n=1 Tax=Streptomyces sp. H27-D2 TaxID=3046304 RepID=UPI002DBE8222|nr:hypothetical protein [Streptomyces sp. H27-D2]MEC4015810.1 hypothetical protein [Streptomyces sp. H27-D2]
MPPEVVLIESRAMRDSVVERVDVLDKVKVLALLPDGVHATTEIIANYFAVTKESVKKVTQRHREELTSSGMIVLRGADLLEFKRDNMSLYRQEASGSYPQPKSNLTLYPRRAVLNIAMLLRDSDVARCVRAYLLDVEETHRRSPAEPSADYHSLDRRVTAIESCLAGIGPVLQELGPVIGRISARLDRVDQRLDDIDMRLHATNRVVCAMSERLAGLTELTPPPRRRRGRR